MGNTCITNKNIYNDINDAPIFTLDGIEIEGKVVSVYDGDSVKIIFPFKNTMYKWTCRLDGIDTPELRTKCAVEKEYAYKVRNILRDTILYKVVRVKCGKFDKYGRLLTTIVCIEDNRNINNWLIENKFAVEYHGDTKQKWSDILGK
jgi:endonuclease YncB( thermonuclease family)